MILSPSPTPQVLVAGFPSSTTVSSTSTTSIGNTTHSANFHALRYHYNFGCFLLILAWLEASTVSVVASVAPYVSYVAHLAHHVSFH